MTITEKAIIAERRVNLAFICIGEALSALGNVRNQSDYNFPQSTMNARLALRRAIYALAGENYEAAVNDLDRDELNLIIAFSGTKSNQEDLTADDQRAWKKLNDLMQEINKTR